MSQTKIEWCDSVWNPTTGCTPISPGCDNCFAKRFAYRPFFFKSLGQVGEEPCLEREE